MDYKNPFNIARDFSATPGLRYKRLSDHSAEELRDDYLVPLLIEAEARGEVLVVELDGVVGYTQSFLHECFYYLVDALNFKISKEYPAGNLKTALKIVSANAHRNICVRAYVGQYLPDQGADIDF